MSRLLRMSTIGFMLMSSVPTARAADEQLFAFFNEEAQVFTASRRLQPIWESPVAVDVITRQDIENSGVLHLRDLLRYRAGVDSLDVEVVEGNRGIVSVRGFPTAFVTDLQVLVDGRSVYAPMFGGTFWDQLPVQLQDVERIEIVRGPNSALYGSNAGLGVINIITKKPGASRQLALSGLRGNRRTTQTGEAFEQTAGRFGYRVSHTFLSLDDRLGTDGSTAEDFFHSNKGNLRGFWNISPGASLELFAGGSWQTQGGADGMTNPTSDFDQHFQMMKLQKAVGGDSSIEVMASRSDHIAHNGDVFGSGDLDYRTHQYDYEALHRFGWLDGRMETTWGAGHRSSVAESDRVFEKDPKNTNSLWRGFGQQTVKLSQKVRVVGAASLENSDTGGTQPAYQAAVLYSPLREHAFRVSYARSSTIPPIYQKEANWFIGGFRRVGNSDIRAQKLTSYEVGYMGAYLDKKLKMETSLYYMDFNERAVLYVDSFAPLILSWNNSNRALARGVETSLKYRFRQGSSFYVNHTYEHITDRFDTLYRPSRVEYGTAHWTPAHKVNLGGILSAGHGVTLAANAAYKSSHQRVKNSPMDYTAPFWRLDARAGYSIAQAWEIFMGGTNLLRKGDDESGNEILTPRLFYGGLSFKFGA